MNIITVESGGSTTPRPIATALSGNLPRVAVRSTSNTSAMTAPASIAHAADTGSTPQSFAMPSAPVCTTAPFDWPMPPITSEIAAHCTAPGTAQFAVMWSLIEVSSALFARKRM